MAHTKRQVLWSQFYKIVEPCFQRHNCSVRKLIYREVNLCTKDQDWGNFLEQVKNDVSVDWSTASSSLKNNFRRGDGSRKVAAAIYYWFHISEKFKSHAIEVDQEIFGTPFSEAHPDLEFPMPVEEHSGNKLDLSRFDAAPLIAFTATKEMNYGTETDG